MRAIIVGVVLILGAGSVVASDAVVAAAQRQLAAQGFYNGAVDGLWGSQSAAAVRRFQVARDLRVTGNLDAATLQALNIEVRPAPTPVPFPVAIANLFQGGPYIGAPTEFQVRIIRQAQENLKLLGFWNGPIDGNPSAALTEALKAYQKNARFRVTGRLDQTTLEALDLLYQSY